MLKYRSELITLIEALLFNNQALFVVHGYFLTDEVYDLHIQAFHSLLVLVFSILGLGIVLLLYEIRILWIMA